MRPLMALRDQAWRAAGSFGWRVKGDAVMAAAVPVVSLGDLVDRVPEAHARLVSSLEQLDAALGSAVELEFTVERGELGCLQLRTFTIVETHEQLPLGAAIVAEGQPASAGVGRGRVQADINDALDAIDRDEPVVLVLETSAPSDIAAMVRSAAVVTVLGGRESHAAAVTRGAEVPAVLAAPGLQIAADHVMFGDVRVAVGDELVVDGTTGRIARPPTER